MQDFTESEIRILPDFIANQIAAGEVVQRPESVVKELVENSLDAGADQIVVVIRGSGKSLIHVWDNGKGMSRSDISLALKRHATSKIRTQEDLQRIATLGFRGEALASISSVASVEIRSRRAEDEHGWKLTVEPLSEEKIEPNQSEKGTQIFVRNLFYNVPARRKFLRSDLTEFRHIADTMTKFAIGNPQVRFVLYDDDALVFNVPKQTLVERITALFGASFAGALLPVEAEHEGIKLHGYITQPQIAKRKKSEQFLFLNGRQIQSRQLSNAVYTAYEHLIEPDMYPPFILYVECNPEKVDVNIHPQKHEVKFEDDRTIYNIVRAACENVLRVYNLVPEATFSQKSAEGQFEKVQLGPTSSPDNFRFVNTQTGEIHDYTPNVTDSIQSNSRTSIDVKSKSSENTNISNYTSFGNTQHDFHSSEKKALFEQSLYQNRQQEKTPTQEQISAYEALFGSDNPRVSNSQKDSVSPENQDNRANSEVEDFLFSGQEKGNIQSKENSSIVSQKIFLSENRAHYWQLHNKYIFLQTERGLYVIDQHVAHERVLYEKYKKILNENIQNSQELLFPVSSQLSPADYSLVKEIYEELCGAGFIIELLENSMIVLRAVPRDVKAGSEMMDFHEIIGQYREYSEVRQTDSRDNVAATLACKASIKSGDSLSFEEMKSLLIDLFSTTNPYTCPHGRPILIEFQLKEFDYRFGRTPQS